MPMHSNDSYLTYEEVSKLVDESSEELSTPASSFRQHPTPNTGRRETFGPKLSQLTTGRNKERSIYTWLRSRISSLECGVMIEDEDARHPIHLNKNDRVLNHFDLLRQERRSWLKKLSNQDFWDHRYGRNTFYFAGQSNPKYPESLVLLDIDCKKVGTSTGALAFAQYLKDHHFPDLYIEVSTNGNGVHAYFVLKKWDYGATLLNDLLLHRLQPWLREIMREQQSDVENIEVKGTLPVIEWGEEQLEVLTYKSGTLAKVPRMLKPDDEEKLRNTTVVTVDDLLKLSTEDDDGKSSANKAAGTSSLAGSISGKHISEEELREVHGHYRLVAESLMEVHSLKTSGKTVATVEDLAIFLMLLKFFSNHLNPDGSLPVKR